LRTPRGAGSLHLCLERINHCTHFSASGRRDFRRSLLHFDEPLLGASDAGRRNHVAQELQRWFRFEFGFRCNHGTTSREHIATALLRTWDGVQGVVRGLDANRVD
jgi:hypothetical protein